MMRGALLLAAVLIFTGSAHAQSPQLFSRDGKFLGNLNSNRYDPDSVANPYGRYGSRTSPDSIHNPYGIYGSAYSDHSVRSRYGKGVEIRSHDGRFLGNLNANRYDPDSVANPYGRYGSPYSAESINNRYGVYGSPTSAHSAWRPREAANTYGYSRTYRHSRPAAGHTTLNSNLHPYSYMWDVPTDIEPVAGE
jgi:hypothetical protein